MEHQMGSGDPLLKAKMALTARPKAHRWPCLQVKLIWEEREREKTNNANISLQVLTYIFIPSTHSSVKVHVFNAVAAACVAKPPQVSSKREYRSSRSWLCNHHHPCVAAALEPDLKSRLTTRLTHQPRSKSRLVLTNPYKRLYWINLKVNHLQSSEKCLAILLLQPSTFCHALGFSFT